MTGEVDAEGAATLESGDLSDFDATVELMIEDDACPVGRPSRENEPLASRQTPPPISPECIGRAGPTRTPRSAPIGSSSPTVASGAVFVFRHIQAPVVKCGRINGSEAALIVRRSPRRRASYDEAAHCANEHRERLPPEPEHRSGRGRPRLESVPGSRPERRVPVR